MQTQAGIPVAGLLAVIGRTYACAKAGEGGRASSRTGRLTELIRALKANARGLLHPIPPLGIRLLCFMRQSRPRSGLGDWGVENKHKSGASRAAR